MELKSPLSFSSPSNAPWSLSSSHFNEYVNPSIILRISSWPGSHRKIARGRGLRYFPNDIPTNAVLKQSLTLSFQRTFAKGEGFGDPSLDKSLFSRLLPARRFRVASKVLLGPRQGRGGIVSPLVCNVKLDSEQDVDEGQECGIGRDEEGGQLARRLQQISCWVVTVVYVGWLFILPYAPGDPAWAISPSTVQMLIDLSINFFFVLPLASNLTSAAGFHGLTAPVLHPTSEALFNIVIGWTLLFAPLLFTDRRRDRFGESLETLWIIQMFLTNTVLAPYMAIRLNSLPADRDRAPLGINLEVLSRGMTKGAHIIGISGALVGLISILWAFIGRPEGGFGGLGERWEYFLNYASSERLAYAFLWDIALYTFFQPWLIGDNLDNVKIGSRETVRILRFVPYVGLVAYIIGLQKQDRPQGN